MKTILSILATLIVVISSKAQTTGIFNTTFSWNNSAGLQNRSLVVYVPNTYNPSNAYKLVIGLHGGGDNPTNYLSNPKISAFVTDPFFGNVILACPSEGTANTSWFVGQEDFGIVQAIINKLDGTYNIDNSNVILNGFSFGGKSAYLHGLAEASLLKGIIAYSPAFYSTPDVNNTCTDPTQCQNTYNYANAPLVKMCITAGSGEYNLGQTEAYLTLAQTATAKINSVGGNALFILDPAGTHNIPPVSICKQCWTHVTSVTTNTGSTTGGTTTVTCDTITTITSSSLSVTRDTQGGYAYGTNSYQDKEKANFFPSNTYSTIASPQVTGVIVAFYKTGNKGTQGNPNDSVWMCLYSGTSYSVQPGSALGTTGSKMSSILAAYTNTASNSFLYTFNFPTPITVPATGFFASVVIPTGSTIDTVALFTQTSNTPKPYAWEKFSDNTWHSCNEYPASWGDTTSIYILPKICSASIPTNFVDNNSTLTNQSISLLPNPTSGLINIAVMLPEKQNINVSIINTMGQTMLSTYYTGISNELLPLNLSSFDNGIYFVRVSNGNEQFIQRIVLTK